MKFPEIEKLINLGNFIDAIQKINLQLMNNYNLDLFLLRLEAQFQSGQFQEILQTKLEDIEDKHGRLFLTLYHIQTIFIQSDLNETEVQIQNLKKIIDNLKLEKNQITNKLRLIEAMILQLQGKYSNSIILLESCMSNLNDDLDNAVLQGQFLMYLGYAWAIKGEFEKSIAYGIKALEILEETGNSYYTSISHQKLSYFYWKKGDLDQSELHCSIALNLQIEIGNDYILAETKDTMGLIYWNKGELNTAQDHFDQALALNTQIGNRFRISKNLNHIGIVLRDKGDYSLAEKYYTESLAISEKINYLLNNINALFNLGEIYEDQGDFTRALDFHQKALSLEEYVGNQSDVAVSLNNIGNIYRMQGDLDPALKMHQKALEIQLLGKHSLNIGITKYFMGKLHYELGENQSALDLLNEAYSLLLTQGNEYWLALIVGVLIQIHLSMGQISKSKELLLHLNDLQLRSDSKTISNLFVYSAALIKQQGIGLRDKIESQDLFKKLMNPDVDYSIKILASIKYVEFLFLEYNATKDESLSREIEVKVTEIYKVAQEKLLYPLVVRSLILKAKFAFMNKNLDSSRMFLEQASLFAEEKNLTALNKEIQNEKNYIEELLIGWKEFFENQSTLTEQLDTSMVVDYINQLSKSVFLK